MSTDTQESVAEEATRKRTVLSLQDRIKVVDYLRGLPEPIVADSNNEIAAKVAEAAGVVITWQQLKYMIDELNEMNLGAKVFVKSPLSTEDQLQAAYERSVTLEAKIAKLEFDVQRAIDSAVAMSDRMATMSDRMVSMSDRITELEAKS